MYRHSSLQRIHLPSSSSQDTGRAEERQHFITRLTRVSGAVSNNKRAGLGRCNTRGEMEPASARGGPRRHFNRACEGSVLLARGVAKKHDYIF